MSGPTKERSIAGIVAALETRTGQNRPLRRVLPGGGRLRIDRQLPFLCVYRQPRDRADPGTRELVTTQAAYLFTVGEADDDAGLTEICHGFAKMMQDHFGVFLLIEIWCEEPDPAHADAGAEPPGFTIVSNETGAIPTALAALEKALSAIKVLGMPAKVAVKQLPRVAPAGMLPLLGEEIETGGFFSVGIGVRPVYQSRQQSLYPAALQSLRRQLSSALRKMVFAFMGRKRQRLVGVHHDAIGPTALEKAVAQVDQSLDEISQSFSFLLQVTPINSDEAWETFAASNFRKIPEFHYRPLPYDPAMLKRKLFEIPLERVEDVTFAQLFAEKRIEIDRQISALREIGTPAFRYSSLQIYGGVDDELHELATQILTRYQPARSAEEAELATIDEIVTGASEEMAFYQRKSPAFTAEVEVSDRIASGMLVVKNRLYISPTACVKRSRLKALLQHEVGTHLLTYFNGCQQPIRQLAAGLAGYEALQEGLAVLAEYLVGGLTAGRLRSLAARVIAVRSLTEGRSFLETFHLLHHELQFAAVAAFRTTLRVYRAGGLTKDAIYLRGLRDLLRYLGEGHEIEPLLAGKLALQHVPYLQELRRRGLSVAPRLLPRDWAHEMQVERLHACRGRPVTTLLESNP